MIRLEAVVVHVHGVARADLDDWIARGWIAPQGEPPDILFSEADLERVRLVHELRDELGIEEDTLPVVLSLLDQTAELRHALHAMLQAVADLPLDARAAVIARLRP